jgi:hypothetical protein
MTRRLLGATLVLSAFLLFLVQPMVARAILPWFGGSASLWTACMLVFQSMLVLGYLYSHALTRFVSTSGQFRIHAPLLVASALLLPPLPGLVWQPTDLHNPPGQIALLLLAVVGLPYLTLSTTAPLLQAWHARLFPERSAYRLYAWSNASSLLALLSYPLLIEPNLTLRHQGQLWSALYVIFVLLCLSCAYAAMKGTAPPGKPASAAMAIVAAPAPGWADRAAWLWLPLVASVVLLGATNEVCHDVFVMPFLWIGPLAIYLVTFVLCFQWEWLYQRWERKRNEGGVPVNSRGRGAGWTSGRRSSGAGGRAWRRFRGAAERQDPRNARGSATAAEFRAFRPLATLPGGLPCRLRLCLGHRAPAA